MAQRPRKRLERRLHNVVAVLARQLRNGARDDSAAWVSVVDSIAQTPVSNQGHAACPCRCASAHPHAPHRARTLLMCQPAVGTHSNSAPLAAHSRPPAGCAASCRWCWPGTGRSAPPAASHTCLSAPWAAPGRSCARGQAGGTAVRLALTTGSRRCSSWRPVDGSG